MKNEDMYSHRATAWLSAGNEDFFKTVSDRIEKNHKDKTCIKSVSGKNGEKKFALFRTVNGIYLKKSKSKIG